jgi:hypothetical protein
LESKLDLEVHFSSKKCLYRFSSFLSLNFGTKFILTTSVNPSERFGSVYLDLKWGKRNQYKAQLPKRFGSLYLDLKWGKRDQYKAQLSKRN